MESFLTIALNIEIRLLDDLLRTRNLYLIALLGLILILYRVYMVLSKRQDNRQEEDQISALKEKLAAQNGALTTKEQLREQIQRCIASGDTEVAIQQFIQFLKRDPSDSPFQEKYKQDALQLSSRFYSLKRQLRNGVIKEDQFQVSLNQLNAGLLDTLQAFQQQY